jgi:hypothetical protein
MNPFPFLRRYWRHLLIMGATGAGLTALAWLLIRFPLLFWLPLLVGALSGGFVLLHPIRVQGRFRASPRAQRGAVEVSHFFGLAWLEAVGSTHRQLVRLHLGPFAWTLFRSPIREPRRPPPPSDQTPKTPAAPFSEPFPTSAPTHPSPPSAPERSSAPFPQNVPPTGGSPENLPPKSAAPVDQTADSQDFVVPPLEPMEPPSIKKDVTDPREVVTEDIDAMPSSLPTTPAKPSPEITDSPQESGPPPPLPPPPPGDGAGFGDDHSGPARPSGPTVSGAGPSWRERFRRGRHVVRQRYSQARGYLRTGRRLWPRVVPILGRLGAGSWASFSLDPVHLRCRFGFPDPHLTGMAQGAMATIGGLAWPWGIRLEPVPAFPGPTFTLRGRSGIRVFPWRLAWVGMRLLCERDLWRGLHAGWKWYRARQAG